MLPYPVTVTRTMALAPTEIKVELLRRAVTMAEIGRRLGVTRSHVSQVISGERRSPVVERAVAEAIGKPVAKVFSQAA